MLDILSMMIFHGMIFSKLNYPNKKGLLTQNGKINATDKYRGTKEINVRQPAIVLLNPEDAGSLLVEPCPLNNNIK